MKKFPFSYALLGCLLIFAAAFGAPAWAYEDYAEVPAGWAVWSCWYWPYNDAPSLDPNLYDYNEAMYRYDLYDGGANSRGWEAYYHGPPQGQPDWAGHCHAWSGASIWEWQPTASRKLNGVTFRVRDQKGLLTEMYFECANGSNYELYVDNPSPGLFWRYLRQEIGGGTTANPSMHGHAMGFVGELYYGPEIWNYPVYKYYVNYSGYPISGYMIIYAASDGDPSYADDTALNYTTRTYYFSGVYLDGSSEPIDSGTWTYSGPDDRPDCIWRPYYADTWTKYVVNYHLDATHLAGILGPPPVNKSLGGVLDLLLLR